MDEQKEKEKSEKRAYNKDYALRYKIDGKPNGACGHFELSVLHIGELEMEKIIIITRR